MGPSGSGKSTLISLVNRMIDFDDGATFEVDATGVQPTVNFADNFPARSIALRVTDSGGLTDLDTTTLEVLNVEPAVDPPIVDPEPSNEGNAITVSATFGDPGINDNPFTCLVNYGDNSGDLTGMVSGNTCFGPGHIYDDNGSYPVTVSVIDKNNDTGTSPTILHEVNNVAPTATFANTTIWIFTDLKTII